MAPAARNAVLYLLVVTQPLLLGTFFVSHEWNDYWLTNALYAQGHEVATNAITKDSQGALKEADINRSILDTISSHLLALTHTFVP